MLEPFSQITRTELINKFSPDFLTFMQSVGHRIGITSETVQNTQAWGAHLLNNTPLKEYLQPNGEDKVFETVAYGAVGMAIFGVVLVGLAALKQKGYCTEEVLQEDFTVEGFLQTETGWLSEDETEFGEEEEVYPEVQYPTPVRNVQPARDTIHIQNPLPIAIPATANTAKFVPSSTPKPLPEPNLPTDTTSWALPLQMPAERPTKLAFSKLTESPNGFSPERFFDTLPPEQTEYIQRFWNANLDLVSELKTIDKLKIFFKFYFQDVLKKFKYYDFNSYFKGFINERYADIPENLLDVIHPFHLNGLLNTATFEYFSKHLDADQRRIIMKFVAENPGAFSRTEGSKVTNALGIDDLSSLQLAIGHYGHYYPIKILVEHEKAMLQDPTYAPVNHIGSFPETIAALAHMTYTFPAQLSISTEAIVIYFLGNQSDPALATTKYLIDIAGKDLQSLTADELSSFQTEAQNLIKSVSQPVKIN